MQQGKSKISKADRVKNSFLTRARQLIDLYYNKYSREPNTFPFVFTPDPNSRDPEMDYLDASEEKSKWVDELFENFPDLDDAGKAPVEYYWTCFVLQSLQDPKIFTLESHSNRVHKIISCQERHRDLTEAEFEEFRSRNFDLSIFEPNAPKDIPHLLRYFSQFKQKECVVIGI